jgi:transketolase
MLATRDHFGRELVELGRANQDIVVINCDLASATRTAEFKKTFPDRFIECGIAEANAISIAAGLAQEGMRPLVCSFGHFLTGKFLEIFQSVGLNGAAVILVGTHAGLAIGKDGPTQMGLRDLAVMRLLPNVQIVQPADGVETRQALQSMLASQQPSYLRLCRQPTPEIHEESYRFRQGHPDHVLAGREILLIAQGATVHSALTAAQGLRAEGRSVGVLNVSSLPVGTAALLEVIRQYEQLVIVEDHYHRGGLGDEIFYALALEGLEVPVSHLAVTDYAQGASPEDLYARYGLDPQGITRRCFQVSERARQEPRRMAGGGAKRSFVVAK